MKKDNMIMPWRILQVFSGQSNTNISIGWYKVQLLALKGSCDEAHNVALEIKADIEGIIPHWIPLYHFMEAIISTQRDDLQGALKHLSHIDTSYLNANRMQIDFVISRLRLHSGDVEGAAKLLERLDGICHFNKAYWSIYMANIPYLLGVAYETLGQPDKAAAQYQRYLKTRKEADPCIPNVEDAKARLEKLKGPA
jgi:tetratricopeptide (TPR) repeat protein